MGLGVYTLVAFQKGDVVCEYKGELISSKEHKKRKQIYDAEPEKYGSYVFEFQYGSGMRYIDATQTWGTAGRLINHNSEGTHNLIPQRFDNGKRIQFRAVCKIPIGVQLFYDYADKNQQNIESFPFLARPK